MSYKACQGDIIWLDFDPQAGNEIKKRRPALVISNNAFNDFMKTAAMICPITGTDRNLPIQIRLDEQTKTTGVVMCDQAKILDMKMRKAEFIERAPHEIVLEAVDIISGFIEI
jgi:mRNA interferase MazF